VTIESRWLLFLLGWALAAAIQLVLYLRQRRTHDATAVDAGWAVSLVGIAALYALLAPGSLAHRVLIASMVGLENLRIARLVLARVGTGEDERYRELRQRWRARGREQTRFFVFFQAQAFLAAVLSIPILLVAFDPGPRLGALAWAGAALWLVAATLERAADRQLQRFKANPSNQGRTLRAGLWRYSRHPNYFFQWLTWVAYALVALEAPHGWLGLIAPALMLYLVLFVTGVPPAEQSSLRSRGEDYRRYQRETSAFVPWFPRERRG
jgi:steroid 5-alpha reductase family enzyme